MDGTYKEGEKPQELVVTFICKVKHNPGSPDHLHQMLKSHLQAKGLTLLDNNVIEI